MEYPKDGDIFIDPLMGHIYLEFDGAIDDLKRGLSFSAICTLENISEKLQLIYDNEYKNEIKTLSALTDAYLYYARKEES